MKKINTIAAMRNTLHKKPFSGLLCFGCSPYSTLRSALAVGLSPVASQPLKCNRSYEKFLPLERWVRRRNNRGEFFRVLAKLKELAIGLGRAPTMAQSLTQNYLLQGGWHSSDKYRVLSGFRNIGKRNRKIITA